MPPAASQIAGSYLCFFVTRATEKQHVDLEDLVLCLTRLRDFSLERRGKELSVPVRPKQRTTASRELNALIHVIFSDTNIEVYVDKNFYLSIG